jgi:hypothetical protein
MAIWALMFVGFVIKDYTITMLSAILFIVMGVYGLINGIANLDNLITYAFSTVHLAIGIYVLINGSIEQLKEE